MDITTIPTGGTNRASGQASNSIEAPVVNRWRATRSIAQEQTGMVQLLLVELRSHDSDDLAKQSFQIEIGLESI